LILSNRLDKNQSNDILFEIGEHMKITVKGSDLAKAVAQIQSVVGKRSTNLSTKCVLLDAESVPNVLMMSGTDLSQSLSVAIPMVPTVASGRIMVPVEKLAGIAKALSGAETVKIATSDTFTMAISGGSGKFTLSGLDPESWPGLITGKDDTVFEIDGGMLAEGLRGVVYAADRSDSTGLAVIGIDLETDGHLTLAATDRARLAFVRVPTITQPSERHISIPTDSAKTIIGLFEKSKALTAVLDGSILSLRNDNMVYSTLLMAQAFLNWRGIMPQGYVHGFELPREAMTDALRGVLLIQDDRPYPVTMSFSAEQVNVKSVSSSGSCDRNIAVMVQDKGGETKFRFNARLVLDWLEQVPSETFRIELQEMSTGIVQFKSDGAPGYVCIPLTLDGDNT